MNVIKNIYIYNIAVAYLGFFKGEVLSNIKYIYI